MPRKLYKGSKVTSLITSTNPNVGIAVKNLTPGAVEDLVRRLQDTNVGSDQPRVADGVATYYVDTPGGALSAKALNSSGSAKGQVPIDSAEVDFIDSVFSEIDSLTGLQAIKVSSPEQAEFVVGKFSDSYYGNDGYSPKRGATQMWFRENSSGIDDWEKWWIASRITFHLALWYVNGSTGYTTQDSVMCLDASQFKGFYGFTPSDYNALVLTLGHA